MVGKLKKLSDLQQELKQHDRLNSSPKIIAVSKLQSLEKIQALIHQGQIDFGENYVQEALKKQEALQSQEQLKWHMIGPLQSNKVKDVVGKFELIHSVGSMKLARLISERATQLGLKQKILLQINLANEETKNGFTQVELINSMSPLQELVSISIEGLMILPPLFEDPEKTRPYFKQTRELRDRLALKEISMGTSSDYLIAAEEGATMVRVGSLIFGERPKL